MGSLSQSVARAFLFADLRNYSAFVEAHGDRAAAELLARYRLLVRQAVAEFDGAEIRTEGDSFYLAFPSASAAVECALRILALAKDDRDEPIPVGIGVHAGETVETAEGYVGSAVNIAARICAAAAAGQVLVSETVRGLTRTSLGVHFVARGRRRLKGIGEAIALYEPVTEGARPSVFRHRRWVTRVAWAAAVSAAVVAVAFLGGAIIREGIGSRQSPVAGSSASAVPAAAGGGAPPSLTTDGAAASSDPRSSGEAELLTLVAEEDRSRCATARPEDGPRLFLTDPRRLGEKRGWAEYDAGIECRLLGTPKPDVLWYWLVPEFFWVSHPGAAPGGPYDALLVVLNNASHRGAPRGECGSADRPMLEEWSFGDTSGYLLCYVADHGDAVLEWAYRHADVYARAIRRDGDMTALLRWWSEHARFGP